MFQVSFPGPWEHRDVVVNGWLVPFLEALPSKDETSIMLLLDRRIGVTVTNEEAERFIPFLADAISFALGYPRHPSADDTERPQALPHPRPIRIHSVEAVSTEAS
jgi:hypothetical protein